MTDVTTFEDPKDLMRATRRDAIALSSERGGIQFQTMAEVFEFARLMSLSDKAVPAVLRQNAGACLAVTIQAVEWQFSPFAVARMAYEVNGQIAYMSQLVHAVIERRAPLKGRLRGEYEGEGDELVCIITGYLKGDEAPFVLRTPRKGDIKVQNSPLWKSDPQQQLWYYGTRAWCRRYCPDVLMGVYSEDELRDVAYQEHPQSQVEGPATALHERLSAVAVRSAGFDPQSVETVLAENGHKKPDAGSSPVTASGEGAGRSEVIHPDGLPVTKEHAASAANEASANGQKAGREPEATGIGTTEPATVPPKEGGVTAPSSGAQEAAPVSQDGQEASTGAVQPAKDEAAPSPFPTSALPAGGAAHTQGLERSNASSASDVGPTAVTTSPTAPPNNEAEYMGRALAEILMIDTEADLVAWDKAQRKLRTTFDFDVYRPTLGKIIAARDARLAQIRGQP